MPLAKMKQEITQKEKGKTTQTSEQPSKSKLSLLLKNLKASDKTCGFVQPEIPTMDAKWNKYKGRTYRMYFCTHDKCPNITQGEGPLCEYHNVLYEWNNEHDLKDKKIYKYNPELIDNIGKLLVYNHQTTDDGTRTFFMKEHSKRETYDSQYIKKDYFVRDQKDKTNNDEDLLYPFGKVYKHKQSIFYDTQKKTCIDVDEDQTNSEVYTYDVYRCRKAAIMAWDGTRLSGKGGKGGKGNKGGKSGQGNNHDGDGKGGRGKHGKGALDNLQRDQLERYVMFANGASPLYDKDRIFSSDSLTLTNNFDEEPFECTLQLLKTPKLNTFCSSTLYSTHYKVTGLLNNIMQGLYVKQKGFEAVMYIAKYIVTHVPNPEENATAEENLTNEKKIVEDFVLQNYALLETQLGHDMTTSIEQQQRFYDQSENIIKNGFSLATKVFTPMGSIGLLYRMRQWWLKKDSDTFLKEWRDFKCHIYQTKQANKKSTLPQRHVDDGCLSFIMNVTGISQHIEQIEQEEAWYSENMNSRTLTNIGLLTEAIHNFFKTFPIYSITWQSKCALVVYYFLENCHLDHSSADQIISNARNTPYALFFREAITQYVTYMEDSSHKAFKEISTNDEFHQYNLTCCLLQTFIDFRIFFDMQTPADKKKLKQHVSEVFPKGKQNHQQFLNAVSYCIEKLKTGSNVYVSMSEILEFGGIDYLEVLDEENIYHEIKNASKIDINDKISEIPDRLKNIYITVCEQLRRSKYIQDQENKDWDDVDWDDLDPTFMSKFSKSKRPLKWYVSLVKDRRISSCVDFTDKSIFQIHGEQGDSLNKKYCGNEWKILQYDPEILSILQDQYKEVALSFNTETIVGQFILAALGNIVFTKYDDIVEEKLDDPSVQQYVDVKTTWNIPFNFLLNFKKT